MTVFELPGSEHTAPQLNSFSAKDSPGSFEGHVVAPKLLLRRTQFGQTLNLARSGLKAAPGLLGSGAMAPSLLRKPSPSRRRLQPSVLDASIQRANRAAEVREAGDPIRSGLPLPLPDVLDAAPVRADSVLRPSGLGRRGPATDARPNRAVFMALWGSSRKDITVAQGLRGVLRFITRHPLTSRRGAAIRKFAAWQLATRMQGTRHIFPWVDGSYLAARRGDAGVTGNYYVGLMDYVDMGFLLHYLRPEDLFVDVGANAGVYTVLASAVVGARTVVFEPVPSTFERLTDHIFLNRMVDRVDARNLGVGARDGHATFTTGLDAANRVVETEQAGAERFGITSLDGALGGARNLVAKIDVEGFELEVLKGAEGLLRARAIQAMIIELKGKSSDYGVEDRDIEAAIRSGGLLPVRYDPRTRRLEALEKRNSRGNTIFVRHIEEARQRCAAAPARRLHQAGGQTL